MDRKLPEDERPRLVRGPSGRWNVLRMRETAEEQQSRMDRLALALHLAGR